MATKLTWLGHAALALETGGYRLLIDPYLAENPAASVSAETLEADFILISHGHFDHVGDAIPIAKRTGATLISNFEIVNWYGKHGLEKTHPQHLGGGYQYPFGYLKLTFAIHGSALPDGSNGGNPAGFLLTAEGKKVYIACDTGLFGDMKLIGEEGIDLAVLPIGARSGSAASAWSRSKESPASRARRSAGLRQRRSSSHTLFSTARGGRPRRSST